MQRQPARLVSRRHAAAITRLHKLVVDRRGRGDDALVLLFCSATVALNQLVGRPTHPGIVDDYRKTSPGEDARPDVFLAPHPEMFGMHDKRAAIAAGAPNPFAKAGDFSASQRGSRRLRRALAKQTAALQEKK